MILKLLGLAGLLVLVLWAPAALARDDDDRSFDRAILDVLLERGLSDSATYDELLLAQTRREEERDVDLLREHLQRLHAPDVATSGGRSGKLEWSSEDGKWSLGVKGRIQVLATNIDAQDKLKAKRGLDGTNFSVRRARIGFAGNVGDEDLTYKLELDLPTSDSTVPAAASNLAKDFRVTDAYLNWGPNEQTDFRWGQLKFPFGREIQYVSSSLNLAEPSAPTAVFAPDREPGAMLSGEIDEALVQ